MRHGNSRVLNGLPLVVQHAKDPGVGPVTKFVVHAIPAAATEEDLAAKFEPYNTVVSAQIIHGGTGYVVIFLLSIRLMTDALEDHLSL